MLWLFAARLTLVCLKPATWTVVARDRAVQFCVLSRAAGKAVDRPRFRRVRSWSARLAVRIFALAFVSGFALYSVVRRVDVESTRHLGADRAALARSAPAFAARSARRLARVFGHGVFGAQSALDGGVVF